jgi:hypothetical protein
MTAHRLLAPALLAIGSLAACTSHTIVVGELEEIAAMRAVPNRQLDLLFVIDDSPSMLDKQLSLAENFPRMMDVLSNLPGGLPDLHIGVVTSDMGTLGAGSPTPGPAIGQLGQGGCAGRGRDGVLVAGATALTGNFISDIAGPNGTRIRNYTGELRDVFAEIAQVGQGGCGFEQHLAATRRALTNPQNAGFLRGDANLAVVIIADEDDCSVLDPAMLGPASPALGPLGSFRCTRFGPKSGTVSVCNVSLSLAASMPSITVLVEPTPGSTTRSTPSMSSAVAAISTSAPALTSA